MRRVKSPLPSDSPLDQPALLNAEHPVRHAHHLGAVGDHDHGLAGPPGEAVEDLQHLAAGLEVEVAGGLVGEDQQRIVGQGAGDGHALLLAPGEAVRKALRPVGEPHLREQIERRLRVAPGAPCP